MTTPLWRYEIPVEPQDLRNHMMAIRPTLTFGGTRLRVVNTIIDATHHAVAIPALRSAALRSEAKEAAKIVRAAENAPDHDAVNHPRHYTFYKGLEIIDLTEQMNFNRGNAVKYVARAGIKDQAHEIQDLEKAAWYIQREIERLKAQSDEGEKSEG